jgi:hypothetical protein
LNLKVGVGRTALACTVLRSAAYRRFMPSEIPLRAAALLVRFRVVGSVKDLCIDFPTD